MEGLVRERHAGLLSQQRQAHRFLAHLIGGQLGGVAEHLLGGGGGFATFRWPSRTFYKAAGKLADEKLEEAVAARSGCGWPAAEIRQLAPTERRVAEPSSR